MADWVAKYTGKWTQICTTTRRSAFCCSL